MWQPWFSGAIGGIFNSEKPLKIQVRLDLAHWRTALWLTWHFGCGAPGYLPEILEVLRGTRRAPGQKGNSNIHVSQCAAA
jgi:hypothetical protein